jgi:twitching motility protein PilJ
MLTKNTSTTLLPVLGVLLALILAGATILYWQQPIGAAPDTATPAAGRLVALVQAARSDAQGLLAGDEDRLAALSQGRAEIDSLRQNIQRAAGGSTELRGLVDDAELWNGVTQNLDTILEARDLLAQVDQARRALTGLLPELLVTTATLASTLPPEALTANQPHLMRFELTVEDIQQRLRAPGVEGAELGRRLRDAEQSIGEILRGLSGQDTDFGIVPATGADASRGLEQANRLFGEVRNELGTIIAAAEPLAGLTWAAAQFDQAAAALMERYRGIEMAPRAAPTAGERSRTIGLVLLGAALALLLLMMAVYYRARDFQREADVHALQNERNQHAILRLLDELSSLADGDLTVQATVTEDITGAIADSINYAIEALRELVATINDTSILVDAAAKQTEGTAKQLVRSSETQSKQAAAASESIGQMAISIEEVSGNAERCSDVARHAVAVAHKGGAAVRRTIDGMNTIREAIQDTSKRIKHLGESSQEIGNIVELIEEIAEQTNILALNASIEASRAGDAGRGFAVVADEVQKLAERSTNATRKIEVLVSTIQSDTHEAIVSMERSTTDVVGGALLAENAGAALDEIEQVSHQIASLVQNISGSAREQTSVSAAITKNMQILRDISSKSMESTSATQSAISKLSELASQLRSTVSGFRLPDHVSGTGVLSQARVAESLRHAAQERDSAGEPPTSELTPRQRKSG